MRRRHGHQDDTEINITPMLDIVFIMLIFFIVTTSFVKEAGIDVSRPTASTSEQKTKGNIMIAIRENGDVWMNKRRIEVEAVRANVEVAHAENPEGSVVIIADRSSETGTLVEVMDQVKLAGVEAISVAAEKPKL
ncbi:MAG: biopolymer transporter ExbD [Gammaproteobacteria bacterium]|nr:biopolymer transporter ExbD [Gammaproteobacteria bacterium]